MNGTKKSNIPLSCNRSCASFGENTAGSGQFYLKGWKVIGKLFMKGEGRALNKFLKPVSILILCSYQSPNSGDEKKKLTACLFL